jgi:hypothetical protein
MINADPYPVFYRENKLPFGGRVENRFENRKTIQLLG